MKNVRTLHSIYITCGTLITLSCIERCISLYCKIPLIWKLIYQKS